MRRSKLGLALACMPVLLIALPVGAVPAPAGVVHEVYPTGDPAQDIPNIQAAIDNASDGDTILLKAGTFNFGDWKTNPIGGGLIVINKGVTVTGDGFDADGNPRTIIQGGSYRQKNNWGLLEWGVVTFSGNASGGVLQNVWLKEPHHYGVEASGFFGQNHENITVRRVKITDISLDIPLWNPMFAIGRSIDFGATIPELGVRGPTGTITIEGCDVSNTGSTVDLDYIDPTTGTPYYRDPSGNPLLELNTQAIGLYINSATSYVIRNNKLTSQNEGIVIEAVGGSGSALITGNQITIMPVALTEYWKVGFRLEPTYPGMVPTPYTRVTRFARNRIVVMAGQEQPLAGTDMPDEDPYLITGMLIGSDNGANAYQGQVFVEDNEIEMHGGDAAMILGANRGPTWISVLNGAVIRNNRIRGTAEYGMLARDGAQYCSIFGNNLATFAPSVAHIGLYTPATHDNTVSGYSGVVDEADGAYNNTITGYTRMSH